ncbi:MAG: C_GCAxxG_C_C family protein [Clostridiales bacterium]|nr:C_GCAxxG_C_C family protein [Clostridiales bacterium]
MANEAQAACEFSGGKNCSMTVFGALAEQVGLDKDTAERIAAGFGGGVGCGSVCGCVTGALMALGMKYADFKTGDDPRAEAFYAKREALFSAFRAKYGTICCERMLGLNPSIPAHKALIKQRGLRSSVCEKAIRDTLRLMERLLRD